MNNFSQIVQQILGVWKQLGINQRISVVLAAGVVVIGLAGLVVFSTRVDYGLLYGRLDDAEAAKVVAFLDDAKVPYKISRGGGSISVPTEKVHLMRMQLAAKGIPRSGDGVGFEILDKPNFGISDFVQRANFLRAVQGELARTISQVDLVESARVMVVMPENRIVVDNMKKPTASVFVKTRGNAPLPPQTVTAIQFLVANSVEGLKPNSVSVVDNSGNMISGNEDEDSLASLSNTQLKATKERELYLAKKAESMLDKVLGPGRAVVRVSAEIDFNTSTVTEERFDPESPVKRMETINDETTDSMTGSPENATAGINGTGGVPGQQINSNIDTNTTTTASTSPSNTSRTKKKVTNNQYEISKVTTNLTQSAGAIRRLSAAVFIAQNYTNSGTNRVAASRSPKELEDLRKIVQNAIGIQDGTSGASLRRDEIQLLEIPFNDQPAMEIEQKMQKDQDRQFWWNLLRNSIYPILTLAILFIFWRTFKRTPSENIPIGIPLGEIGSKTPSAKEPVITVDALNQLIRENPGNMTQAIRSWMGKGPKS
jgi:flagellar M-ring protein FliF